MASPTQIKANKQNAKRSTGPRTAAGKKRSSGNSLKHGLTGEGLCLPIEDAAVVQSHVDLLSADFCPQTPQELFYTQRAATLLLRVNRCNVKETYTLRMNVRDAIPNHDRKMYEEMRAILDQFPHDPYGTLFKLKQSAQGIDYMVEQWRGLRVAMADAGHLDQVEEQRAEQLSGRRYDASGPSPFHVVNGKCQNGLERVDGECRTSPEQVDACIARSKLEMESLIGRQIEDLLAHRATLSLADAVLSRQEAPMRAAADTSNAGQLLRRYETAAARELHKIFDYFEAKKAEEASENLDATPVKDEGSAELASSGNDAEPAIPGPATEPETVLETLETGPPDDAINLLFTLAEAVEPSARE